MTISDNKVRMGWEEYKMESETILKFDNFIFTIKSWSISSFGILLTIYFTKILSSPTSKIILNIGIILSLVYWIMEYMYKRFQSFHITRCRLLEIFLNNIEEYDDYRVPDNQFRNKYGMEEEQRILKGRGFISKDQSSYRQVAFRVKFFLNPHTSSIYLLQVAICLAIIIFG